MEELKENFMDTLNKFLKNYLKYEDNKNVKNLLKLFSKIDFLKTAKKVHNNLNEFTEDIENKNEECLDKIDFFISGVNFKNLWEKLGDKKDKFWLYLKILNISSEMIVKSDLISQNIKNSNIEFNPYVGLDGGNLDMESIKNTANIKIKEDDKNTNSNGFNLGGLGQSAILNMLGGNKMNELKEMTNKLKNMTDEDINEVNKSIKDLFGEKGDSIAELVTDVSKEFKNINLDDGDLMSNFSKIADSVSKKISPKIESGELDPKNILNSTKGVFEKIIPKENMDMINNLMNGEKLDMSTVKNMMGMLNKSGEDMPDMSNIMNMFSGKNGMPNMSELFKNVEENKLDD